MPLTEEQIKNKLQEAKKIYGITYSNLAKEVGITPVAIYNFINHNGSLAKDKQLQLTFIAQNKIQQIKDNLKIFNTQIGA